MLILAIETSTQICSLALLRDKKVLAEWYVQSGRTHSTGIMYQLNGLLERSKIAKSELQAIAVNIGPGSFTGLRIGLSLGKALAIALNIPIIGVSSDKVLACAGELTTDYLAVLIDAQRDNFYYTLYKCSNNRQTLLAATRVAHVRDIEAELSDLGQRVLLTGDYNERLFTEFDNRCILPEHVRLPRATNLGILATELLVSGQQDSAYTLGINYIKPSEAEIVWENKHNVPN